MPHVLLDLATGAQAILLLRLVIAGRGAVEDVIPVQILDGREGARTEGLDLGLLQLQVSQLHPSIWTYGCDGIHTYVYMYRQRHQYFDVTSRTYTETIDYSTRIQEGQCAEENQFNTPKPNQTKYPST
jgi:hypothetical protein